MPENARLRLEPGDGSPVIDYRLQDNELEKRVLDASGRPNPQTGSPWQRLTPEHIAHHITSRTIVAYWLRRKLGWRNVLRKCSRSGVAGQRTYKSAA